METQTLRDVPASEVEQVVSDFESEGYTVTKQKQSNRNYTVVASRPRPKGAVAVTDASTVVLHNVKRKDLQQVVTDLTDEGYTVTVQPEPDGEFTVIGVRSSGTTE